MNNTEYKELIMSKMYAKDGFSQWAGMEILAVAHGYAEVQMQVRTEMCNGFGVAHGGITFSLADSAFAFACNTYDGISVSIETSITHLKAVYTGDVLIAKAKEISRSRKLGTYLVEIHRKDELVAHFKGTCYHKG